METRWLQDSLTLADTGNFTRAAGVRHTSHAAFSRCTQAGEGWLGATLIDRGAFPTRLVALAGQGVAWLPDCALRPGDEDLLEPMDAQASIDVGAWSGSVTTMAVRDHTARRPSLDRLWDRLVATTP